MNVPPASPYKSQDIADIPPIPGAVLKAAAAGKLVVFVGAGVSRIIGCPSWKQFALLQLRDLRENSAINYYEYESLEQLDARKLLSICRTIYQERNLSRAELGSFFRGNDELIRKHGGLYQNLYAFNAIFITTNYDDYLDQEAQKLLSSAPSVSEDTGQERRVTGITRRGKVITPKDGLLISALSNGNVVHLHGGINDEGSAVITIVDYMKHYEQRSRATVLLETIFREYTVLFVGYGLEEYEVMEFMITKAQTAKNEVRHFMLYPVFRKEGNILEFQRKYYLELGVELIPYPKDDNGYEQLANVIREWSSQIGPISRPQGFIEKIRLIDEVI